MESIRRYRSTYIFARRSWFKFINPWEVNGLADWNTSVREQHQNTCPRTLYVGPWNPYRDSNPDIGPNHDSGEPHIKQSGLSSQCCWLNEFYLPRSLFQCKQSKTEVLLLNSFKQNVSMTQHVIYMVLHRRICSRSDYFHQSNTHYVLWRPLTFNAYLVCGDLGPNDTMKGWKWQDESTWT